MCMCVCVREYHSHLAQGPWRGVGCVPQQHHAGAMVLGALHACFVAPHLACCRHLRGLQRGGEATREQPVTLLSYQTQP